MTGLPAIAHIFVSLVLLASAQARAGQAGECQPTAAEALVGKNRVTDTMARNITSATSVRQINPGAPETLYPRPQRVTIITDPASDKIVRAFCG